MRKQKTKQICSQIKTMAIQINYRELAFARFKFVYDNDKLRLSVLKGCKTLVIELDEGRDLYNIRKLRHRNFKMVEDKKINGVYCDQLADIIEDFFNFEYINKPRFG